MKTLASLALAATTVAGAAQAQEARVPDRYGPAPRTLSWQSAPPARVPAAERHERAERAAPLQMAAASAYAGRTLGWAGKTQAAAERLPAPEPAPAYEPAPRLEPPPVRSYREAPAYPADRPPAFQPEALPRAAVPPLRPAAAADLPTSLYDAPRAEPALRPRQPAEPPLRRASVPPPRTAPVSRHVEPYPVVANPYRSAPEPQPAVRAAAPVPPPAAPVYAPPPRRAEAAPPVAEPVRRPPPAARAEAPAPQPSPVRVAAPSPTPAPAAAPPVVPQASAPTTTNAAAPRVGAGGVPVPPSEPPRIAARFRATPEAPARTPEPVKVPAKQTAAVSPDFDLAPAPARKPLKTAAVGKRAAEPAQAAPPVVAARPPRLYSLHREYGMTPDPIPAPKGNNYVLIGPPDEPAEDKANSGESAGGVS